MLSSKEYKELFPALKRKINGHDLIYLDNAATTLRSKEVMDAVCEYSLNHHANVHRSSHTLAAEATKMYEDARERVANFIDAENEEIIFTKGATESINLIAYSLATSKIIQPEEEILITTLEHHANFVPWQQIGKIFNIRVKYYQAKNGIFNFDDYLTYISHKTRVISITAVSNVTGQVIPIEELISKVRQIRKDIIIVVDGAQSVPHLPTNVKKMDADFLVFSGHKMLGPTGVGVLFGKKEYLNKINPFLFGGEMIDKVTTKDTSFNILPYKFEAGTPNVDGAVGLAKAIEILEDIGMQNIKEHDKILTDYAIEQLKLLNFLEIYGPKNESQCSIVSFNVKGIHPHDVSQLLNDLYGIAIRSGHHCAQPIMEELGVKSTCRISFYIYNEKEDIDKLILGLKKVWEWLK
ncbi:SufS family cysteine desulfurase [Petrotoga sp. 9PWA.NaAc.5.4]|uniref:SufS family cysteine desulfurase n=1 Tax=Petrotoga sp. 9PWA.NaAc.5.4 TaxID=1434328 RepID=UPI000CBDFF66|nr:SufS family cysteine desulfurase [Petrotoga sp. 9PWA.NaAc.5.4]PNR92300.1 cysteine desulfurase [Petrotoga sp. 9PWA.NaAc.5.4]